MALNPRAKMLAAIAATKQNPPTSGGPLEQGKTPSNPQPAPTAAPSQPSGEPVQPTALGTAALLDKANQAVTEAIQKQGPSDQKQGPSESVKVSVPSLNKAMARLQVKQQQAQEAPPVVEKEVKVLPTPKDPALKSAAELSIVARAKLLKETGEQYESVFHATPWPESYLEDFDADGHLNDLKLLEQQLLTDEELLPTLMIRIHQNLKRYEDLAHLLTEEQIQVIVCAFAKRKNIEIVAAASGKSASTKGRSVQAITKDLTIEQVMGML